MGSTVIEVINPPPASLVPPSESGYAFMQPIRAEDAGLDIQDPLFDAYYGEPNDFGSSWTSRFGLSPPPPPPPVPTEPNPLPSFHPRYEHMPIAPSASTPGSARAALIDRLAHSRSREARAARVSDFASYSARRRAVHRSSSRSQLDDAREREQASWDRDDTQLMMENSGNRSVDPDSDSWQLNSSPRPLLSRPVTRPRTMFRSFSGSGPMPPPVSSLSSPDLHSPPLRSSSSFDPVRDAAGGSDSAGAASFDDLRHRLEAYPRRGSWGSIIPTDDQYGPVGPSSLSIRPSHTPRSSSPATLLLTQGRSRSRSPPVSLYAQREQPRPLRRQNLRAPEIMETMASGANTTRLRRHGSMPPSGMSSSLLGVSDGTEVLFRSPSPMPSGLRFDSEAMSTMTAENRAEDREGSLPPPVVQLLAPRSATPEIA